jgi:hypothetical protein
MEQQRADFERPNPDFDELFRELATDTPKTETRRRVVELLRDEGLLAADELPVPA